MTESATSAAEPGVPTATRDPKSDIFLLVACQALLFTNNVSMIAVNGLAGLALAPNAAMATVPVTSYVIGSAIASAPIARMMKRYGDRKSVV